MTWKLIPLKKITTKIGSGATPRGGNNSYKTEGITLIRSLNVHDFEFSYGGLAFINEEQASETRLARVIVEPKDILLNITGASVARCCIVPEHLLPARVNQHVSLVRVDPNLADSHYVLYCLNSPVYKHQLLTLAQGGATREALTQEIIGNLEIPLPPIPIQCKIANFLERKAQQINELIRIKERRIELLQEQRTALINQAVTKGLDPNVEMKPSGVEFIGEIPAHWESKRLAHVSTIFKGGTPKRNVDRYFQGDLPWARPVDITALQGALYIHDTEIHISEEALGNSGARRLPPGTVLLTSRATIGETAITTVPMATNQGFANFVCNEQLLNIYLTYYLRAIKDLLISLGNGSTFLEVTKGTLVGVGIPLPPLPEQKQIVDFLEQKNKQIDELISEEQRKIELLKEYRQSLISEAVTGKIDIRSEV